MGRFETNNPGDSSVQAHMTTALAAFSEPRSRNTLNPPQKDKMELEDYFARAFALATAALVAQCPITFSPLQAKAYPKQQLVLPWQRGNSGIGD